MTWIKTISYDQADTRLKGLYDRVASPDKQIDNILLAHSLRPHTLNGHMTLYKSVLHHSANKNPKVLLELLGVCVSRINRCDYCDLHHTAGFMKLETDEQRGKTCLDQVDRLVAGKTPDSDKLSTQELAALRYSLRLTLTPVAISKQDIQSLRDAGFDDGQILELNQVVSYFAYANRMVLGLGVNTNGEVLGLSPGDSQDETNWTHA